MTLRAALIIVAALSQSARAEQKIDVFVNNGVLIPAPTLQFAKMLAADILTKADVRVAWHGEPHSGWKGKNRTIIINMVIDAPPSEHPGALGTSYLYEGGHLSIYYGRIQRSFRMIPFLLAYVMVHEITHLILGVELHSATGIMKARWDLEDYYRITNHTLGFEAGDIRMIRESDRDPVLVTANTP